MDSLNELYALEFANLKKPNYDMQLQFERREENHRTIFWVKYQWNWAVTENPIRSNARERALGTEPTPMHVPHVRFWTKFGLLFWTNLNFSVAQVVSDNIIYILQNLQSNLH